MRISFTGRVPKNLSTSTSGNQEPRIRTSSLPSPCIRKLTANRIQYRAQEDAILQTNVDEHCWLALVDTCIEHLGDAYRRWGCRKSLQADDFEGVVRIEGNDTHCLVFATNSLHTFEISQLTPSFERKTRTYKIWCPLSPRGDFSNT